MYRVFIVVVKSSHLINTVKVRGPNTHRATILLSILMNDNDEMTI